MKIVMLTGSPHLEGTSALLADCFTDGACEKGNHVVRFDAAHLEAGPCLGCGYCQDHSGACAQQDDMDDIIPPLLDAHLVAFVTPLYYFGMTAQLKAVVDRFYAVDRALSKTPKGAVLLATCNSKQPWAMEALTAQYRAILKHLNWEDRGMVLAQGAGVRADIEKTDYPDMARELGFSL